MRIGIGYDIHRYQEGRPLILGGVSFPGEMGLGGHSDADVLLHAVIDALLGAAALGDIGQHFPADDPSYTDANSLQLLARAGQLASGTGFRVEGIDATIIAERPVLTPHSRQMCRHIAQALVIEITKVNVKATTNEGIGALGRGEGVAALAVVLLAKKDES